MVTDQRIKIMVTDKDPQIHPLPCITLPKTVPHMIELEVGVMVEMVMEDPLMVEED